ncbi:MAG: oligopeptidase A, partial [Betaproteobacteria bacterium]|nr:oligopeptidase A [Betaproteobacteria bacterium]
MKTDVNPLLDFSGLPRFSTVKPEHVGPAIDLLIADCRATVARLTDPVTPATWREFVEPLEDANERLSRAWGIVAHLHGVIDSPPLRDAYNANQPKVVQYWTELGHNEALFAKYKTLRAGEEYSRLDAAQRRIIDNELRDFRLSGAELPADQKKRFAKISEELASLATRFAENVLDATNAFSMVVQNRDE